MRECFSRLQKMILTEAYKNKGSIIIDDVYQKYFGKIGKKERSGDPKVRQVIISRSLRLLRERGYVENRKRVLSITLTEKGTKKAEMLLGRELRKE